MDPLLRHEAAWIEVSRAADRRTIRQEALALQAVGVSGAILEQGGEHVLVVRAPEAQRAVEELARYRAENVGWPPREGRIAPVSEGVHAALAYGGLLVLFFTFQVTERFGLRWSDLGRADADAIRGGEWWRTITALSLHADLAHVAGNVVFGGVLGVILAQSVGVGLTWWTFLVAGTLGNLANALLQAPSHRSLGASTGVFAILGAQIAYEWMRRADLGYRRWRRWVPVVMGVGLLAWLGMGGVHVEDPSSLQGLDRVDIGAHALGFAFGALIGLGLGLVPRGRLRMSMGRQALFVSSAALALVAAWALALR